VGLLVFYARQWLIFQLAFFDESNIVKLGGFGSSKQLAQASFANTHVGVSECVRAVGR
jgi:hypothetical protein